MDELYRALIATFAPNVAQDPQGMTCVATKKCAVGKFGDIGYVYVASLGFALWVPNVNAAQPQPSIPYRLDVYTPK